jgi:acyl-CoA thioesterase YciA
MQQHPVENRWPTALRDPIIRTVPQPADMNGNGDIFGGWVLSQMDVAGGALAARVAKGRVATVAITAMTFVRADQGGRHGVDLRRGEQGRPHLDHHRLETVVQRRTMHRPIA